MYLAYVYLCPCPHTTQMWGNQLCTGVVSMGISLNSALCFSVAVVSDSLWLHGLQHARLPCPSLCPRVCSNSCPLSQWCHPTISSSVAPFSCLLSFLALGSFPMSWLFISVAKVLELQLYIHPSNEYSVLISYMFKFSLGIIIRIFDHLFACFLKRKKTTTSNSKKRYCKN